MVSPALTRAGPITSLISGGGVRPPPGPSKMLSAHAVVSVAATRTSVAPARRSADVKRVSSICYPDLQGLSLSRPHDVGCDHDEQVLLHLTLRGTPEEEADEGEIHEHGNARARFGALNDRQTADNRRLAVVQQHRGVRALPLEKDTDLRRRQRHSRTPSV